MMRNKVIDDILCIFVNLNDQGTPDYYIATSQEAREKVKQYAIRGIIDLSTLKRDTFFNRWDKLELAEKKLRLALSKLAANLDFFAIEISFRFFYKNLWTTHRTTKIKKRVTGLGGGGAKFVVPTGRSSNFLISDLILLEGVHF
jgi:hypothetical protein